MTWVRLDEDFDEHPKVAAAGPLGLALQVRAICYCNRNLTDGFISSPIVRRLAFDMDAGHEAMTDLMVQAGLWERAAGGIRVHDYLNYNPTRAVVLAEREQRASMASAGGRARIQTATRGPDGRLTSSKSSRTAGQRLVQPVQPEVQQQSSSGSVPVSVAVTESVTGTDPDPVPPRAKATAPDGADALGAQFRRFYESYPVHKSPDRAERAFRAALKSGATLDEMLAAIVAQRRERESLRSAGKFVPQWQHPATWLHSGGWKDEPLNATAPEPAWEPPEQRAAKGDRSGLAVLFTPPERGES